MEQGPDKTGLLFVKLFNQKIPEFKEVKRDDWIHYGSDNLYPDYLIDLYERSATHGAIINGKSRYVMGEGWTAENAGVGHTAKAKAIDFIKRINKDQTLDELSSQIVRDFEMYDGFYLEVIPNKLKTDITLNYMPFNKIRTNSDEDEFYYSNDWTKRTQDPEKTGFEAIPKFSFDIDMRDLPKKSLFFFRILSPRKSGQPNVYPIPGYVSGTQSIETEVECSNFNLSEVKSNFSAGSIVNFYNGVPTKEDQKALKRQIINELTGTDSAGQLILNFADSKDNGSEVIALNGNDLPDRYMNVRNTAMKTIFTSHGVSSPSLFGVQQENVTFGSRMEIAEQYEIFQNTYISGRQQQLESVFNKFASYKKVPARLKIKPTVAIQATFFTESTIVNNLPKKALQEKIAEMMGVDLSKYENATVVSQVQTQMSSEDLEEQILQRFEQIGRPKEKFNFIKSQQFTFEDASSAMESELSLHELYAFKGDDLGVDDEDPDPSLKIPKITRRDEKEEKIGRIEILYSYEERRNAPKLKGESRNFCKRLLYLDKLYTRREIESMSNDLGTNVWLFKGGWYTNPNTDAPVPYCRHIWEQHIVKVK